MIINEVNQDLFSVSEDYVLCHCISSDLRMGAGIAVEFQKRFSIRELLTAPTDWPRCYIAPTRVYNLVTKQHYYDKPTIKTLETSLRDMALLLRIQNVNKIAMPAIGCGLDKLQWKNVRSLLEEIFDDFDLEILVCFKGRA